jgi:uncharacterized protein with PIN domain
MTRVRLRFQGELNDFLSPGRRGQELLVTQQGRAPLRHLVESVGVPHTEVARAMDGDRTVGLDTCPEDDASLLLYPWSADLPQRPPGGGAPSFAADAHLGHVARKLRLLGFDTRFDNDLGDARLVSQAIAEGRVLLSRDRQLLMRADVRQGCYVPDVAPRLQLAGLVARFQLCAHARPFSRCMDCNGLLQPVALAELDQPPPPGVVEMQDAYWRCSGCGKLYWRGTHWRELSRQVAELCGPSVPVDTP